MSEPATQSGRRRRALVILTLIFGLTALGYGAWWFVHGRHHETTDDAYVAGNLIRVTPRVAGTVVAVLADDTDYVKQGQVLVKLDDTDARLALAKAEAALGTTVRQVGQSFDLVAEREASLRLKQETLRQAKDDLARRQGMADLKLVSKEETEHARAAVAKAQADLDLAQAQLRSAKSAVHGTAIESYPSVAQAAAQVREAYVALSRCEIRAAENGYIAKRGVQVGQQVAAGTALMALVPLDQLWVDANFKEDQLERMRIGQPVELRSDLYGSDVTFHGKIVGVDPGTGATFSLLPPQNASGNWIKIVQRLPVRITLDPQEIAEHPLLVGLSMKATADMRDQSGAVLASGASATRYETPVFDDADKDAAAHVRQIIAANRGSHT